MGAESKFEKKKQYKVQNFAENSSKECIESGREKNMRDTRLLSTHYGSQETGIKPSMRTDSNG